MRKKLNLLVLAILLLGQTILTPLATVNTVFATGDNMSEQVNELEEATPAADQLVVTADLKALLTEVETLSSEDYTDKSFKSFMAEVDAGKTVLENPAATQAEVDQVAEALQAAVDALEEESSEDVTQEEPTSEGSAEKNVTTDGEETLEVAEEDTVEAETEAEEEKLVDEAYEAALEAVEKALETEKRKDIEKALALIEAVEDEALQEELAAMLADLQVRPASEQDNEFFSFQISDITDLQGNAYGEDNPLKPNDEFWVGVDWELKNGHAYQAGDTTTFQLPKELALSAGDEGELKDSLGNVVATYVISQSGEVTLTFTEFVENNSNVTGWLEIRAELDQNVVEEENGKVVIGPIENEGSQEIPIDRSPINKTVEKQGKPNKSYNADEIEWTVTINKNANSLKDVTLEDLLPAGTEYVEGSLKAVKQGATLNGTLVGEKTEVSVTPSTQDGKLSIPLGDIEEVYTLTYTTKVTDTEVKSFKNNVTFKDADLEDTNAEATVTINRGEPLKKGAVKNYDPKTGIIEWYLDINYNQKDLTNVTLADSWANSEAAGKMALVDGTVKFQEMTIDENGNATAVGQPVDPSALGATLVKEEDGFKVTGITTDKAYRVVYQTKATDRFLDGFRIENAASFNGATDGTGYSVGQYIGVKSVGNVDYKEKTIEWQIKVNLDEVSMNDVVITDTLGEGLTLLPDSFTVTHGGAAHNFDVIDASENPFKIDLGNISKEVIIKYKTSYDADKVPGQKPTNKANVNWKNPDGTEFNKELNTNTQLNDETVDSSWKNASYNPDTKEITWTIIANYRENAYDDFKIIDKPQGNQKLLADTIEVYELNVNANGSLSEGNKLDIAPQVSGNEFTLNIGSTKKAYGVTYKTSVAGLEDLAKEYANKAQVLNGNEVIADLDAKTSVYGDRKYGNKRGQQDGRRVNWSIDVNLAQEKISNLKLEDTISDNQAYIEDSIKVYNAKLNKDGTLSKTDLVPASDYDLVVNETDFTVSWKNDVERAFIVEYSTLFFAKEAEKVRNDYKVTGDGITENDKDASDGYNVTIKQTSGGGAEGTAGYLLVHKVDTTYGQVEQPLAGIQFELIDTSNDKVLKTVTTDENGYADFGRLLFGEYKLREVNALDGYVGFDEEIITIDKPFKVGESDPLDYKLEIENYKANGDVELVKRDEDSYALKDVEFTLFTQSGEVRDTKVTDDEGKLTFENLEPGSYYIQETKALNGFELDDTKHEFEITEEQKEAIQLGTIVNKYKTTEITLKKEWRDPGDQSLRPDFVTVNLFQNGTKHGTYEIKKEDNWELTIDGLQAEDENGKPYEYTMTEQEVPGYVPSFSDDGLTVTNTRAENRDITITKSWLDQGNENRRPESITVELKRAIEGESAQTVDTYEISAENGWELTLTELPMFDESGQLYNYTVKELEMNYPDLIQAGDEPIDYETTVDGFDITNTAIGKTKVHGEKRWNDGEDIENRPQFITVYLFKNGEKIDEQKVEPNNEGQWKYEFDDLDRFDENGRSLEYFVQEESVFGYQTTMSTVTPPGSPVIKYDIWNTRVGSTGLFGTKTWEDNDNAENTRPKSIEVEIYQNDKLFSTEKLSEENNWMYGMVGLPAYDENGNAYEYTIQEVEVEGYETSYDGYNITNRLVGETEVSVTKEWKGEAQGSVAINLLANDEVITTKRMTAEDDWTHTFTDLPKYDYEGKKIAYTVEEVELENYISEVTGDAEEGFTITNTRAGETEVSVTKAWLGAEGEKARVHLLANGEKVEDQSIDLTTDNDWTHTFTDLNEFDASGQPIEYTVVEDVVDGFTPNYSGNATDGFFITNVRTGETSVDITKTWKDEDATDRPETIKVNLLANDVFVSEHEVSAANDWALTIDELPKYDENGEEIVYTISEQDVPGYESSVDGFNITNTRVDEKSITINKAWLDNDAENRPTSIEVELFRSVADGEKTSVGTYDVSAANDWTLTIDELPAFDKDGKVYTYEIEEAAVEGYESTVNGFDITNLRVGKIAVDVSKVWKGEAAESATVYLLANGQEVKDQEVDLTKDNDWKHTFANLDKYDEEGKEITYTVKEVPVAGYETQITGNANDGFTVTNTRVGTTVIAGTKTWDDKGAEDKRPKSITITVLQNGEAYDTVTVTPKSSWTYNIPNLPAYDENGKPYEYDIVEDEVEGYKSSVDGFDLTNTQKTYALGDYVWIDRNKDGVQDDNEEALEGVKVELYDEDGNKVAETETDKNGRYIFDELPAGKYKVKFTLTDEQAKKYKFTKQNAGDNAAVDSDADKNGWTTEITLNDDNEYLTQDYEDQAFKATEGIDPTWDAGVIEIVTISGTKTWKNDNSKDRPESIIVELLANGEKQDEVKVTGPDWNFTFEGLDKYDANGEEITYTIDEVAVEGYEKTINGFDITNTFISEEDPGQDPEEDPGKDPEEDPKEDPTNKDEGKIEQDELEKDLVGGSDTDKQDGGSLPKTATNTFNILLIGVLLTVAGLFIYRKRKTV